MTSETSKLIPDSVKNDIINNIIIPSYKSDISYSIRTRNFWGKTATFCGILTTLLIGLSSVFSFLASKNPEYNTIAGLIGILSIVAKEFSSFSNLQDHLSTVESNEILQNIGINFKFPDTSKDIESPPDNSVPINSSDISYQKIN